MFKRIIFVAVFSGISSVAIASSGGASGSLFSSEMLFKTINFLILLFILHRFAKKPIANMLSASAENTKKTVDETSSELEEAKKTLADYQTKLANLKNDLEERKKSALSAIETETQQLIKDAEKQVKKLEEQSQARIEQDTARAKAEIREFLVSESVKIAEETISKEIGSKEQKALLDNYAKFLKDSA